MTIGLSVGVPAYNQASYLGQTVASLLTQDRSAGEIVVSDNHSTDGTAEVLASFGDAIRVIRPPAHLPPLVHWDWLVGQLSGDWFTLMSSDDVATPAFVRTLAEGAEVPGAVLVHAGYDIIDEVGKRREVGVSMRTRARRSAPETLREQLVGPIVNLAAFAARRPDWEELGGFSGRCELLGDWALWLQLVPRGLFVYNPTIVSGYRVYERHSRPGELEWRVLPSSRDLVTVYQDVIPTVARQIDGVGEDEIVRAGRQRLRRHLGAATTQLEPAARADVAAAVRSLGEMLDCAELVDEFEHKGLPELPYFRFGRVRRLASPVLDRVRAARAASRS